MAAVRVADNREVVARYEHGDWRVLYSLDKNRSPADGLDLDNAAKAALDTAYIVGGQEVHDEFEV